MSRRGYTLIELMIVIAILAIWLAGQAIPANYQLRALQREADYHQAVSTAQRELARLKSANLSHEPPELMRVGADGWVKVHHAPLVGHVTVWSGVKPVQTRAVEAPSGRIQLAPALAGQTVCVAYSYPVSESGESHSVPPHGPCRVRLNHPATQVAVVWLARGEQLTALTGWRLEGSVELALPAAAAGHVVMVDYQGGPECTRVTGQFVSLDLKPVKGAGPFKLLTVEEGSVADQHMVVQLLRAQP